MGDGMKNIKLDLSTVPWKHPIKESKNYLIFEDKYPVTKGHILIVPKYNTDVCVTECFSVALQEGNKVVVKGDADAFNIGYNCGEQAGQTVMWPHIHVIPRRSGDCEDPVGGVRAVIPGKANYRKTLDIPVEDEKDDNK
jgi:diadenosine tetraphosphate (Ap4A) HIT family hydrolase